MAWALFYITLWNSSHPDGKGKNMVRYTGHAITFAEVPDEVSLCLTVSNCGFCCEGCHSPELREDVGADLEKDLPRLLERYRGRCTCCCFMGCGKDPETLYWCVKMAKDRGYKTALYTGDEWPDFVKRSPYNAMIFGSLNYLKVGPYVKDLGGLESPTTNQRMFRIDRDGCHDITHRFQDKRKDFT